MQKISGLLLLFFMFSCHEAFEHKSEYDKSFQKWQNFKQSSRNTYQYVSTGRSWVGSSWETEIVVESGKVKERNFRYTRFLDVERPQNGWDEASAEEALKHLDLTPEKFEEVYKENFRESLEWSEKGVQLGLHTSSPASGSLTLDEIYQKAQTEWLASRDNARIYFETKNDGLISLCGYSEKNCADDCFRGISIASIGSVQTAGAFRR